jgi:transcriptional regulator with XRE-family HTH domain
MQLGLTKEQIAEKLNLDLALVNQYLKREQN